MNTSLQHFNKMRKKILFNPVFVLRKSMLKLGALMSFLMMAAMLSAQINVSLTPTAPSCNGYTDGNITSTVSGGVAPYAYLWSNGTTIQDLYGIPAGTYTLIVTDGNGNNGSAEVTVTEPDVLQVEIGVVGNVCLGTAGTLQAAISGGTPPYDIMWNNGTADVNNSNLLEGVNAVDVSDANGCLANALMVVGAPMSIEVVTTDVACGGGCDGSAEVIVTGGQGPFTYLWSNGETGSILQNLEAGEFCVTVTDGLGCTLNDCGTVGQPSEIEVSLEIVYDEVDCGEPETATATVTVTGGEPPYIINWSNGTTGPVATGLTPGSYSVNVADQTGCNKTLNFKIEKPPVLTCDIQADHPDCLGGSTGSATVSGIGGTPPYSYIWSNGANTATVTDLAPGNYTATVTDNAGCEAVCFTTINNEGSVSFFLTAGNAVCGNNGSALVTITEGTAPFNITWNGPVSGEEIGTSENPFNITGLVPGQYLITVVDADGCDGTQIVRIDDSGDIRFQLIPSNEICGGDNGSIQVVVSTGTPQFDISWSGPESGNVMDVPSPYTIENLTQGEYTISVVDANGCFEMHTVTVGATDYDIPLTLDTLCVGSVGTITATWNAGEAPYTLEWTAPGSTDINTVEGATSPTELTGLTVNGNYSFTVTDANGCDGTGTIGLNCSDDPVCNLTCSTTTTPATCDAENGTITVTVMDANGPVIVSLEGNIDAVITDNPNGTFTISGLAEDNYTVIVTEINNPNCISTCSADVPSEEIDLNPSISLECMDSIGQVTVSWSLGTAPYTLEWTAPDGTITTEDPATSPFVLGGIIENGTYSFTITDNQGCEGDASINVMCPMDPECLLSCSTTTTPAICDAENGTITVTVMDANGPVEVSLNDNPDANIIANDDGTYTITDLATGNYIVKVTEVNDTTCMTTCATSVGQEDIDLNPSISLECMDSIGQVTVSWTLGTAPYTLVWTAPDGTETTETGATSPFILGGIVENGTYSFTITDDQGCDGNASINVMCPMDPCLLDINLSSTPAICKPNGTITVEVLNNVGPYSVTLIPPDTTVAGLTDPSFTFTDLGPDDYTVIVMDSIGCADTATVSIGLEEFEFDLVATDECNGSIGTLNVTWITVNGTPPYQLDWINPAGIPSSATVDSTPYSIDNLVLNGTYSFTITDGNMCMDTTTVELICPPPCMIFASSTPDECESANGTITIDSLENVSGQFILEWTGPESGSIVSDTSEVPIVLDGLPAGDYTLTIIDETNVSCETTVTVEAVGEGIDVNASYDCVDSTAFVTIEWTNGVAPDTLSYTGPEGQSGTIPDVTSPFTFETGFEINGVYVFTIVNALGCDGADTINIECPNPCELACISSSTPALCETPNGTITVEVSNFVDCYDLSINGVLEVSCSTDPSYTFTGLAAGTYEITVIDSDSCIIEKMVTVGLEDIEIDVAATAECSDSTGMITVTWSTGSPTYTLVWSDPAGQLDTVNNATSPFVVEGLTENGEYTFTVIDTFGCDGTTMVDLDCCNLEITAEPTPENCLADNGTIEVTISNGTAPYTIEWSGTESGSDNSAADVYTITDLTAGDYTIIVTDSLACSDTIPVVMVPNIDTLSFNTDVTNIICETPGQICVSGIDGIAP